VADFLESLLQDKNRPGFVSPHSMRTADYRASTGRNGVMGGGARVGMPERPPDLDADEFINQVTAGRNSPEDGVMSGFGRFLSSQETITPAPKGGDAAWTDRAGDGTPGRGKPIEDQYEAYEPRKEVARMHQQAVALRYRIREAVRQAEEAERVGRMPHAAHFDRMAERLAAELQEINSALESIQQDENIPSSLNFD
jgi:hypothetical protein